MGWCMVPSAVNTARNPADSKRALFNAASTFLPSTLNSVFLLFYGFMSHCFMDYENKGPNIHVYISFLTKRDKNLKKGYFNFSLKQTSQSTIYVIIFHN